MCWERPLSSRTGLVQAGSMNGSLLPLATLLVGWVKVPGEVPQDFSSPLQDRTRFSEFPHTSAPSTSWLQEVSGSWRDWSIQRASAGDCRPSTATVGTGSCGSDALQGPSPLRAAISATRWHCDPAEWQRMPESIVSGEISPPPPAQHNNLCMVCVPLALSLQPAVLSTPGQTAVSACQSEYTVLSLSANAYPEGGGPSLYQLGTTYSSWRSSERSAGYG